MQHSIIVNTCNILEQEISNLPRSELYDEYLSIYLCYVVISACGMLADIIGTPVTNGILHVNKINI